MFQNQVIFEAGDARQKARSDRSRKSLIPWGARADLSLGQNDILYDAFGKLSAMEKDWGFAALIEYGGKLYCLTFRKP